MPGTDASHSALTGLRFHAVATLCWALLLFLVPIAPVLGSAASVSASVLAIALIPAAIAHRGWRSIREEPAIVVFIAVFLALGACFLLTARTPRDPIYAFNFIALPLAAVVYVLARRTARPDAAMTLVVLSLAATLSALIVAFNDIVLKQLPLVHGFGMGPHVIARLTLTFAFLSLAGLFVTRSRWRFVSYLGLVAGVAVLFLSGTRGALLALPPMAAVFAVFVLLDRRDRWQFWVLAGAAVAAVAVLALNSARLASVFDVFGQMIAGGATTDSSANQRLVMLSAAWELFQASPLIGYGWANFAAVADPLPHKLVISGPTDLFFQFHNDLANFAVAAGSIGVLCWAALLAAPVVGALAGPRDGYFRLRLYCCVQLSVGYLFYGLTDFTLGYDLPTTLYAFLTAIVLGAVREPRPMTNPAAPAVRLAA